MYWRKSPGHFGGVGAYRFNSHWSTFCSSVMSSSHKWILHMCWGLRSLQCQTASASWWTVCSLICRYQWWPLGGPLLLHSTICQLVLVHAISDCKLAEYTCTQVCVSVVQVAKYKGGKTKIINFFMRQVQKELNHRAHSDTVLLLLQRLLSSDAQNDWQFRSHSVFYNLFSTVVNIIQYKFWIF